MDNSKEIILEELEEQAHPVLVEHVIFWALEHYAKTKEEPTWGKRVAAYIVDRIKESEEAVQVSDHNESRSLIGQG